MAQGTMKINWSDSGMVVKALERDAERFRSLSRQRCYTGPKFAERRAQLRNHAKRIDALVVSLRTQL